MRSRKTSPTVPATAHGGTGHDRIEASLRRHYFHTCPDGYLESELGSKDLRNHLVARLERDRIEVVPWLCGVRPIDGARVLEIGCGTGSSTVALAERGAIVTGIDVDSQALIVARDRCREYGVSATLLHANAVDIGVRFAAERFDCIIFYASLEHMTIDERLRAMKTTWDLLETGSIWCVIETPNRLWYFDAHTSHLPFFMWLPDEVAFRYSRFSPRPRFNDVYKAYTDEARLHFLRRGRGVSFHEFELTMKPVRELSVVGWLGERRRRGLLRTLKRRFSDEHRYISLLRRVCPGAHEAFLQPNLDLAIEKT